MGYEVFLILLVMHIVLRAVSKACVTFRSRMTVTVVSFCLYIFYFLVWPSPIGFSMYTKRPYFRGAGNVTEIEVKFKDAGKKILKKIGFEAVPKENV